MCFELIMVTINIFIWVWFMIIDDKLYNAGLVLCLFWNVIAVTAAWIKGEGEFRYIEEDLIGFIEQIKLQI